MPDSQDVTGGTRIIFMRHRLLGLALTAVVAVVIAIAAVVGVSGLLGNPVRSSDAKGVAQLAGSFDPLTGGGAEGACATCPAGYVRDGGRSVFVVFPAGCAPVPSGAAVQVSARLDTSLGAASYRALRCNGDRRPGS